MLRYYEIKIYDAKIYSLGLKKEVINLLKRSLMYKNYTINIYK